MYIMIKEFKGQTCPVCTRNRITNIGQYFRKVQCSVNIQNKQPTYLVKLKGLPLQR